MEKAKSGCITVFVVFLLIYIAVSLIIRYALGDKYIRTESNDATYTTSQTSETAKVIGRVRNPGGRRSQTYYYESHESTSHIPLVSGPEATQRLRNLICSLDRNNCTVAELYDAASAAGLRIHITCVHGPSYQVVVAAKDSNESVNIFFDLNSDYHMEMYDALKRRYGDEIPDSAYDSRQYYEHTHYVYELYFVNNDISIGTPRSDTYNGSHTFRRGTNVVNMTGFFDSLSDALSYYDNHRSEFE